MAEKLIQIKSEVAITVFKQNIVERKQVITGQRGDGSQVLKKVVPGWHKKESRFDIKKGINDVPDWVLKTRMVIGLVEQQKIVIVDAKAARKIAADAKKEQAAKKETVKEPIKKEELPD